VREFSKQLRTRSQAVDRIADRTASQQLDYLVIIAIV